MTQSYRRPNYSSNFSYDAWRLSGKPSRRKIPITEEFTTVEQPKSSSARASSSKEKTYHPFIVVGSCNEINKLSTNVPSNKHSISTHSVDRISKIKYRDQISFSSSLSIRKKEFVSLDNDLHKCIGQASIASLSTDAIQGKDINPGKSCSSIPLKSQTTKTTQHAKALSHCTQSQKGQFHTKISNSSSSLKFELTKFQVKRTSTPSHQKRISVKSFFTKKKNTSSFSNSIQDAAAAGCSSWRGGSTKKSPFSSPCKIPVAATGDIDHNNNITQPSQSPRKKIYYSEKQSDDINGAPSVPPTTPDFTLNDTIESLADLKSQRSVFQKLLRIGSKRQERENNKIKKQKEQEKIKFVEVRKEVIASQRRQIYFLNKIMTKLENDRFEEFKSTHSGAPV